MRREFDSNKHGGGFDCYALLVHDNLNLNLKTVRDIVINYDMFYSDVFGWPDINDIEQCKFLFENSKIYNNKSFGKVSIPAYPFSTDTKVSDTLYNLMNDFDEYNPLLIWASSYGIHELIVCKELKFLSHWIAFTPGMRYSSGLFDEQTEDWNDLTDTIQDNLELALINNDDKWIQKKDGLIYIILQEFQRNSVHGLVDPENLEGKLNNNKPEHCLNVFDY